MDEMTTADAAKYLGVTPRTLYKLLESHRLSSYRKGRVIVLDREEVEHYHDGFDGFDDQAGDREPRNPLGPDPWSAAAEEPTPS
jgi:excisionase family DNA binding protein